MKKSIYLFIFICFLGISNLKAQATAYPIATLEHNGTTTVFYGYYAFRDAYNSANNFDTIYLSADNFNSSTWIYKTIHVFGAGSTDPITPATTFNDWLYLGGSSDSSSFEGIYMPGVGLQTNSVGINFRRCRLNIQFQSGSPDVTFENNYIYYVNFNWSYGQNSKFRNNLFINSYFWSNMTDNATGILFEHNTFYCGYQFMGAMSNCYLRNNIIYVYHNFGAQITDHGYSSNVFERNIINEYENSNFAFGDTTTYVSNVFMGNYYSVNGNYLNTVLSCYSCNGNVMGDYHLMSPQLYPGTDSTQVGMYGGVNPWKEYARPSNPQIISKTIPFITNQNGILPVNVKAKAQNY